MSGKLYEFFTVKKVGTDGVITEENDRRALEKVWQLLAPVLKSKGLFDQEYWDVNTSWIEGVIEGFGVVI